MAPSSWPTQVMLLTRWCAFSATCLPASDLCDVHALSCPFLQTRARPPQQGLNKGILV